LTSCHPISLSRPLSLLLSTASASATNSSPLLDINLADSAGWTCLHNACLGGYPEHESHASIVALLLTLGARVEAKDCCGLRPIHVCSDPSALRLLLASGADPNAVDDDLRSPLHMLSTENCSLLLEQPGIVLTARDRFGRTPLHLSSEVYKSRLLIGYGFDRDARDASGQVREEGGSCRERMRASCVTVNVDQATLSSAMFCRCARRFRCIYTQTPLVELGAHESSQLPPLAAAPVVQPLADAPPSSIAKRLLQVCTIM
jgi:hypothetical protein